MQAALLIFLGGGLGSLARYAISLGWPASSYPKGTLIANAISCIILGVFIGLSSRSLLADHHRLLLATGFCGGFSTFSTYSAEIVQLYQSGEVQTAVLYGVGSIVVGIIGIVLGMMVSRLF